MRYQRGSLNDKYRRRVLMVLEPRFQLGVGDTTLASLLELAASAGKVLQESWVRTLVKFLCDQKYLTKKLDPIYGAYYGVNRSIPELKTNEEFVLKCLHPYHKNEDVESVETVLENAGEVEESSSSVQTEAEPSMPAMDCSTIEQPVLEALTERTVELTNATKELQKTVVLHGEEAEALKLEIAKQREEFRSTMLELQTQVSMTRANNDSNAADILGWITKSETIGEHSKTVMALKESIKELTEAVQPLKCGAAIYQKNLEVVAARYKEEMDTRHRESIELIRTMHRELKATLQIELRNTLKQQKIRHQLPKVSSKRGKLSTPLRATREIAKKFITGVSGISNKDAERVLDIAADGKIDDLKVKPNGVVEFSPLEDPQTWKP